MIIKFENFTFGDLEPYQKDDLEDEISNYEGSYEFWTEESDVIKEIVNDTIKEFKYKVPIFDKIHVQLVKNFNRKDDQIIGMYSHQSVLRIPIVFLGVQAIYDAVKEYDVDLDTTIRTTLFHELGHAIVDVDNMFVYVENKNILEVDNEEEYVENFAYELEMFNKVSDPNILKLAKLYKTANPIEINEF